MKKLALSLLLSAVAVNAFGMEDSDSQIIKSFTYPIATVFAIGWGGYYASEMWSAYMIHRKESYEASLAAKVPHASQPSSWAPYAKIAAGLGLTGLTAYLGCKQTIQPQSIVANYKGNGSSDVGNTLSPNLMISFASAYTLAPMIPAYYFLKSGFDDLNAERDANYYKTYIKDEQTKTSVMPVALHQPAPTYK